MGEIRDEEDREGDALQDADEGKTGNTARDRYQQRGHQQQSDAEEEKRPATDGVDPRPHQRLAYDAHRAVPAHHDADVHLGAAEALDVEGKQYEDVEAEEEKEVRDGGAEKRVLR